MSQPMRQEQSYTYADVLTWPEGERWELIDGVPYNMTPAPSRRHQEISTALIIAIGGALAGSPCRVFHAPFDVRLPKHGEDSLTATTVVQPDLAIICDPNKLDAHGAIGSPSLVVEILSPYTAKTDRQVKMRIYAEAGVPEYWIVAPGEKTVEVYLLEEQGKYGSPAVYQYDEQVPAGAVSGLVVDLPQVFSEEPGAPA